MDSPGNRILIIVENLSVPFDRRVWLEATALKQNGYEVNVICPRGTKRDTEPYAEIEGIRIFRHPHPVDAAGALGYALEYGNALFHEFHLARHIYKVYGFDAIHACNPPDLIYLVGSYFKRRYGTRFLFDHHDINPELFLSKFKKKNLLYHLMAMLEKKTFRVADISIATNESYRKVAIDRGGMNPDRVHVVRNGPRLDTFTPLPPDQALKHGKKYMVGYVGTIAKQEGIEYLLKAAQIIRGSDKHDQVHFTIVGKGPDWQHMVDLSRSMGLSDMVEFTGRIPDDDLRRILSTADVCVNPDEANEMNDKSTMIKIMEYMAMGKPIVQFDLKEGRVSAGEASLYARHNDARDFAEKIQWLLDHPSERKRMGEYGQMRVKGELAWDYQIPRLLNAYEHLLSADLEPKPVVGTQAIATSIDDAPSAR